MKRVISNSLMIIWIVICPIISLWANSYEQNDFHFERIFHQHYKTNLSKAGKQHDASFDELSIVDDDAEHDLFSIVHKFVLTPQYFIFFLYAGLFFLLALLFKRKLPTCDFLAPIRQHSYLSKRALLI